MALRNNYLNEKRKHIALVEKKSFSDNKITQQMKTKPRGNNKKQNINNNNITLEVNDIGILSI